MTIDGVTGWSIEGIRPGRAIRMMKQSISKIGSTFAASV
jgi:hypothetical protein